MNDFVYCIGVNYRVHLFASVASLCHHNGSSRIHIFHDGLSQRFRTRLSSFCAKFDCIVAFRKVFSADLNGLVLSYHFQVSNYYRLLVPQFLDGHVDRYLYLDADTIVCDDLSPVFDVQTNGVTVCAVENPNFDRHGSLKMNPSSTYFNSGVILVDVQRWIQERITERTVMFVRENSEAIHFVDQCGLNAVIDGEWCPLHPRYNQQTAFHIRGVHYQSTSSEKIEQAISQPAVVHYTGSEKPWHVGNRHPERNRYCAIRKHTPYAFCFDTDRGAVRRYTQRIVPARLWNGLRHLVKERK